MHVSSPHGAAAMRPPIRSRRHRPQPRPGGDFGRGLLIGSAASGSLWVLIAWAVTAIF